MLTEVFGNTFVCVTVIYYLIPQRIRSYLISDVSRKTSQSALQSAEVLPGVAPLRSHDTLLFCDLPFKELCAILLAG